MIFLLLPTAVSAFFFPPSGCSCGCAPPPVCPPIATCAIPEPCPEISSNVWSTGIPAIPAIPAQPAVAVASVPAVNYFPAYQNTLTEVAAPPCTSTLTAGCNTGIVAAVPAPAPIYVPASIQQTGYSILTPPISSATDDERYVEVVAQPNLTPTLIPPVVQPPIASNYDDYAPPPPPPPPPAPIAEYKTSETYQPSTEYQSAYAPKEAYDEGTRIHSGATGSDYPKVSRKVSTEGFMEPLNTLNRRNLILKRMRNVRTMSASIPHTNATCNSSKLANVMARAIVPDVSVAKRMVMRSAELAFDGAKFDVFCATGEFSYSIHSRKYCEVTRDEVTCFAFR